MPTPFRVANRNAGGDSLNNSERYIVRLIDLRAGIPGSEGVATKVGSFSILQADTSQQFRYDSGLLGGEVLRLCASLQLKGYAVVLMELGWWVTRSPHWPSLLINLALEQFA